MAAIGRETARYVEKLLKGADPRDLPVQQVSKFELVLNLRTGRAASTSRNPSVCGQTI
jgi:putative ABC transport system substrate-binding protein